MRIKIDIEGNNVYDTLTALENVLNTGRLLADRESPKGRSRQHTESPPVSPAGVADERKTIA